MKPGPSRDLIAASSRPLVLSILGGGDNYGYAIIREVKRLSGGHLDWKEGMLYPVLHRLEAEKLIESNWRRVDGRRRKYYRLTDAGNRALVKERQEWEAMNQTLSRAWAGAIS